MRSAVTYLVALLGLCLAVGVSVAQERILNFDSVVEVQADGAYRVTETIRVRAEGNNIRRGIYRDFPLVFEGADGRERKVDFELTSAMRDGVPENSRIETASRALRIYLGRADVLLTPGIYIYRITYETDRQLRRFDNHDEVYWNVTGNDWAFPIEKASALITLPQGGEVEGLAAFTGYFGSTEANATSRITREGQAAYFETSGPLGRNEGLTVAVKFQKGIVPQPGFLKRFGWFLQDFAGEVVVISGALLVLLIYWFSWDKVGRDPPVGVMVPRWDAPDDVSPALANYIENKGLSGRGFTALSAAALNLAVKGLINVDNSDEKIILENVSEEEVSDLPGGERVLVERIRAAGGNFEIAKDNSVSVKLVASSFASAMEGEHRSVYYKANFLNLIPGIVLSIVTIIAMFVFGNVAALLDGAMVPVLVLGIMATIFGATAIKNFTSGGVSAKIKGILAFAAVIMSALPFAAGAFSSVSDFIARPFLLSALLALAVINIVFFFIMGAPTQLGRKRMDELAGLKRYLTVAEADRMNMTGVPLMSPSHYETLLPYAVALGVEKQWSATFQTWLAAAVAAGATAATYSGPSWYRGNSFNPDSIADSIGGIGSSIANSMTQSMPAPKSSSSGFSGGGGSSGGGGGGGGGGGW
jgi:uncharacterized membrane protein YgcG